MYLVDTNIWLERLLGQEKSEIVGKFLDSVSSEKIFISDFALHSIGVILTRLNQKETFLQFIEDLFLDGSVSVVKVEAEEMPDVVEIIDTFKLDFDDAYQYIATQKNGFTLVSFDKDFDKTTLGRTSPENIKND